MRSPMGRAISRGARGPWKRRERAWRRARRGALARLRRGIYGRMAAFLAARPENRPLPPCRATLVGLKMAAAPGCFARRATPQLTKLLFPHHAQIPRAREAHADTALTSAAPLSPLVRAHLCPAYANNRSENPDVYRRRWRLIHLQDHVRACELSRAGDPSSAWNAARARSRAGPLRALGAPPVPTVTRGAAGTGQRPTRVSDYRARELL
jgi:hypothetical protein